MPFATMKASLKGGLNFLNQSKDSSILQKAQSIAFYLFQVIPRGNN